MKNFRYWLFKSVLRVLDTSIQILNSISTPKLRDQTQNQPDSKQLGHLYLEDTHENVQFSMLLLHLNPILINFILDFRFPIL